MLETDLPRYDVILERARRGFERGRRAIPDEAGDSFIIEQEELGRRFTIRFLFNIFRDVFGNTSRAFRVPFPEKSVHDYLRVLLDEEIRKLNRQKQAFELVQEEALAFFGSSSQMP